jgi:hypothetical protein
MGYASFSEAIPTVRKSPSITFSTALPAQIRAYGLHSGNAREVSELLSRDHRKDIGGAHVIPRTWFRASLRAADPNVTDWERVNCLRLID